jgi:hypothetical protein
MLSWSSVDSLLHPSKIGVVATPARPYIVWLADRLGVGKAGVVNSRAFFLLVVVLWWSQVRIIRVEVSYVE